MIVPSILEEEVVGKTFKAAAGLMAVLNGTPQQAPDGLQGG